MFFVYEHWRPDTNTCFYVGKGKGDRAWSMRNRNRHHRAIREKLERAGLSIEVRIVFSDLTEDEAFALEVERIAMYGEGLCNITTGGEGFSGGRHTTESKRKISIGSKKTSEKYRVARSIRMSGANNPFFGKQHPPEVIERIKEKNRVPGRNKGAIRTAENKQKISATLKSRGIRPPSRKGAVTPQSVREKQAESMKRYWTNKKLESATWPV
jgi:hypothetical protein